MPIYSNTDIINSIKGGNINIGSAYLGYTRVYGVGENRPEPISPGNITGLTAWYEAEDYTNGSGTWSDKSGNGYILSISESYATGVNPFYDYRPATTTKATISGGTYVDFPKVEVLYGKFANTENVVTELANATEITLIQIRTLADRGTGASGYRAWGFGIFNGFEGSSANDGASERIGMTVGGQPDPDGVEVNAIDYGTTNPVFTSYRVTSPFSATNGNVIVDYATTSTSFTRTTDFTQIGADPTTFAINASPNIFIAEGSKDSNPTQRDTNMGVYAVWPRILTDEEIEGVYNYYKSTYSLA